MQVVLRGELCEMGEVEPGEAGFRMVLSDNRVITVLGLSHEEVRDLPRLYTNVQLAVRED